jgi:hypothetical protein
MSTNSTAHTRTRRPNQQDREEELPRLRTFGRVLKPCGLGGTGDVMAEAAVAPPVNGGNSRRTGYVGMQRSIVIICK